MLTSPSVPEALHRLRARSHAATATLREHKARALADLRSEQAQGAIMHTPSGPRRKGEGVHDEQGILAAEPTPSGGARLRITLLAAGFVLGPSGCSVREIIAVTGADIRSWSENWHPDAGGAGTPVAAAAGGRAIKTRTFVVEGKRRFVVDAITVISAAVDRYNELCGGVYSGQAVDREQAIAGVSFYYSPPPRAAVPYAASLRNHDRPASPPARKPPGLCSPPSNKENAAALAGAAASVSFQLHALQRQRSGAGLHVLSSLPATPAAAAAPAPAHAHAAELLPQLATLLPGISEGMVLNCGVAAMEEGDVETPAYSSGPTYSLFASGGGLAGGTAFDAFNGGASLFASAFEAATPAAPSYTAGASGHAARTLFGSDGAGAGFLAAGTPSLPSAGASLFRQLSFGEDALLAAAGLPGFSHQTTHFQPQSLGPLDAPPSAAMLHQAGSLLGAGALPQAPLAPTHSGVQSSSGGGWWHPQTQAAVWPF